MGLGPKDKVVKDECDALVKGKEDECNTAENGKGVKKIQAKAPCAVYKADVEKVKKSLTNKVSGKTRCATPICEALSEQICEETICPTACKMCGVGDKVKCDCKSYCSLAKWTGVKPSSSLVKMKKGDKLGKHEVTDEDIAAWTKTKSEFLEGANACSIGYEIMQKQIFAQTLQCICPVRLSDKPEDAKSTCANLDKGHKWCRVVSGQGAGSYTHFLKTSSYGIKNEKFAKDPEKEMPEAYESNVCYKAKDENPAPECKD